MDRRRRRRIESEDEQLADTDFVRSDDVGRFSWVGYDTTTEETTTDETAA